MRSAITALEFLILMNLLALPVLLLENTNYGFEFLAIPQAGVVAALLGGEAELNKVIIANKTFIVSKDSAAWKSLWFFASLMLASLFMKKGASKKDVVYVFTGLLLILAANVARIASTIAATLSYGYVAFDFMHLLLWRAVMMALPLALWIFWLRKNVYYIESRILFRVILWKRTKAR